MASSTPWPRSRKPSTASSPRRIPSQSPFPFGQGPGHHHRCRQARAPSVGLLGISLTAVRRCLVENNECQGVAGLGHRVAMLACDLSGHAACIFRNHFAETVALDGHLLSGFDLVIELDQMLDEPAL